jgi:hypothetical protein
MTTKVMMGFVSAILCSLVACSAAEPTPTPTSECQLHDAALGLSVARTTVRRGEQLTVTVYLSNTGCARLGLPEYRLFVIPEEGGEPLDPVYPASVVHSLAVAPGDGDSAEFTLRAAEAGLVRLEASVSFEAHLGYPGPAYWASCAAEEGIVVRVEP